MPTGERPASRRRLTHPSPRRSLPRAAGRRGWPACLLAGAASAVFLVLATPKLVAQGPYYDELHQAPAAFTYTTGVLPPFFVAGTLFGFPALNLSYVGAAKSAVIGGYLALTGQPFDLATWRLFGIVFVALGLAVSVVLAYDSLRIAGTVAFVGLMLSDSMVLLGSRHDWGPIALALALRLTLVGVWFAGERASPTSPRNTFVLGLLVGFALFEKLTNVVLLPALIPLLARRVRQDAVPHVRALALGGVIGSLPLLAVNVASYADSRRLASVETFPPWLGDPLPLLEQIRLASSVGMGCDVSGFILGVALPLHSASWRLVPLAVMLLVACLTALRARSDGSFRLALPLFTAYAVVIVATDFLPRDTGPHHWVMATPFQYAGLAAVIAAVSSPRGVEPRGLALGRALAAVAVLLLLTVQAVNLVAVERALWRGLAATEFDPSLNRLGAFVATRVPDARFVATDWGVATQMLAFASGSPGAVEEVFWSDEGDARLADIARGAGGRDLYFVAKTPPLNGAVARDVVARVQQRIARFPCFEELPLEPELASLTVASVRRARVIPGCLETAAARATAE